MLCESNLILAAIALSLVFSVSSKSLNVCPDEHLAHTTLGSTWVEIDSLEHTSLVRRIRLPQEGLFDDVITCLLVTDAAIGDSGANVEITAGGIYHRFVELRLTSGVGKGLNYLVLAYADPRTKQEILQN